MRHIRVYIFFLPFSPHNYLLLTSPHLPVTSRASERERKKVGSVSWKFPSRKFHRSFYSRVSKRWGRGRTIFLLLTRVQIFIFYLKQKCPQKYLWPVKRRRDEILLLTKLRIEFVGWTCKCENRRCITGLKSRQQVVRSSMAFIK